MPERKRERLNFGVETRARAHHTAMGTLVVPFVRAWKRLRPTVRVEEPIGATRHQSLTGTP
jgi:hypothetical protein